MLRSRLQWGALALAAGLIVGGLVVGSLKSVCVGGLVLLVLLAEDDAQVPS